MGGFREMIAERPLWALFIAVNLLGFLLMGFDKGLAKAHLLRIPERILMIIGFLMGALGIWLGMLVFRHKTKQTKFRWGVPILFVLQGIAVYFAMTTNWS